MAVVRFRRFGFAAIAVFRASSSHPERVELHAEKKSFVDVVGEALGIKKMRVVEAGRSDYLRERTQECSANMVGASPGVVYA